MRLCHGSGAFFSMFLLVILRVVTVEIHGCRTSIASAPTTAGLGKGSDGIAECTSRRRACVGRSSDQDYTTGPSAPAGWTTQYSSWTGGGYSCTREAEQVGRQRVGMCQLEFRDESFRGSHRSSFVGGHDDCGMQYGCYEQRYDDGRGKGKLEPWAPTRKRRRLRKTDCRQVTCHYLAGGIRVCGSRLSHDSLQQGHLLSQHRCQVHLLP